MKSLRFAAALAVLFAAAAPAGAQIATPTRWQPAPDARVDVQFSAPFVMERAVDIMVLDLTDAEIPEINRLRSNGTAPICVLNAGTAEAELPDFADFPPLAIGRPVNGDPNERWLDIRNIEEIAPVIRARLDLCRDRGYFGVLPINLESNLFRTGFPTGTRQQDAYNRWLANEARARGLAIGLWNTRSQVANLADTYDFVMLSDCFEEAWCNEAQPFIDAGKPVYLIDFDTSSRPDVEFCEAAMAFGARGIIKRRSFDGWLRTCPPPE